MLCWKLVRIPEIFSAYLGRFDVNLSVLCELLAEYLAIGTVLLAQVAVVKCLLAFKSFDGSR